MPAPLLEVKNLSISFCAGKDLIDNVSFEVKEGDVLILQGKSGCGKSTLMKCLAQLNVFNGGVWFCGKTPSELGVPKYRTHVLYVPQRPSMLPGTPRDFITHLSTFHAHKARYKSKSKPKNDSFLSSLFGFGFGSSAADEEQDMRFESAREVASEWGIDDELWERPWATLSGGEAQRIALSVSVGLDCADILLLDEPTSALDADTSQKVEQYLCRLLKDKSSSTKALVWITHSAEQGHRVGTRFLNLENGGCREMLASDEPV